MHRGRNKLLKEHNSPFTFEEKTGHSQCNSARGEEPERASLLPTWGGKRLLTKRKHNHPGTSVLEKEIPEPQDKGKSPHKDPPEGNMIIRDKSVEESDEILLTDVYLEADIAQLKTQMKMRICLLAVVAESKGHESLE